MKFDLGRLQITFDELLRRAYCRAFDALGGFVDFRRVATGDDFSTVSGDLRLDLDQEHTEAEAAAVGEKLFPRIQDAANQCSEQLVHHLVHQLNEHERPGAITVPAGDDPTDPAVLRSVFNRAVETAHDRYRKLNGAHLRELVCTILHPGGSQPWFFAALDRDQPGGIGEWDVRLLPVMDLLEPAAMVQAEADAARLLEAHPDPTPEQREAVHERYLQVVRRAPWYVILHANKAARRPFVWVERERPHLTGPKLALAGCGDLTRRPNSSSTVARVEVSKLILARVAP